MARHFALHTDIAAVHLQRERDGLTLIYEMLDDQMRDESQLVEHGFALTVMELKALLGSRWQPEFAQFRYAAPYNLTPLQQVFGERLHFNQDRNALHVLTGDLERPIAAQDLERRKIIGRQLSLNLEAAGQQLKLRAELALRAVIAEQACQLEAVASALGMSARTLQRQLQDQGSSFQALYDKVRIDLARKYLAHSSLSIAAVAERLHFSETAAFTRHFKRHTGMTPRAFRRQGSA
jgi:AraC-like DNA-binding protein